MSDQPIFDDEELSALVKRTIAEELAKRAKAEQQPKSNFENRVDGWLDTSVIDPEEEETETDAEQATRWMEEDKKPELNAFGNVLETQDEVWHAVREAGTRIYEEQQEKQRGIEAWLREAEEEIAQNKKANG